MNSRVFNHAYLKVERAEEILGEIKKLMDTAPPYAYVLETDTQTNQRATLARKNQLSLDKLVIRCGELFHNLRSAIDQAYFVAIAPNVPENKHQAIQFPFAKDSNALEQTIKWRQGDKAGQRFFDALKNLNPFFGRGGNILLALLHEVNIVDKHKFPTPTGNFSKIDSATIQAQVPDFPGGLVNCGAGRAKKDVVWTSRQYNPHDIGDLVPPFMFLYQKVLELPVETWFYIDSPPFNGEIIQTMSSLINETKSALDAMAEGLSQSA